MGFELFQKTVWRSAAARLQQRPKRGAQRNSIARGLARPSEDAGLLGVWAHAGFLGGALRAALRSGPCASRLRLLGPRRPTPRPAPAPPSQRLPRGLGVGEVEEGSVGLGSRARASAGTDRLRAARSLALGACVVWCVRVPGRRREPTPRSTNTRGRDLALQLRVRISRDARLSPAPFPSLAPQARVLRSHTWLPRPPFPDSALGCPSPHTLLFVFVGFVNVVFVRELVSSTRCLE